MQISPIEWTDLTWNPLVGCTKVSRGCKNCYAMKMAARIANAAQRRRRDGKPLTDVQAAYLTVVRWKRGGMDAADEHDVALAKWNGRVALVESLLVEPLRWKKPRMVFVNSMSDLFHEAVPFDFIDRVYAVMALCPQHVFQVLTKRPERACEYTDQFDHDWDRILDLMLDAGHEIVSEPKVHDRAFRQVRDNTDEYSTQMKRPWPLPNVWLGTSVEDQATADKRIPWLKKCAAAVRFLSCEPMVGRVDLLKVAKTFWMGMPPTDEQAAYEMSAWLHWVICGGESGHGVQAMNPDWARLLRDQCAMAGIAFFFKQWGNHRPIEPHDHVDGRVVHVEGMTMLRVVSKHAGGNVLDGKTHKQYPAVKR
jgi:protein gp37